MRKLIGILLIAMLVVSCGEITNQKSDSGVSKATIKVKTDMNGNTTEQRNIMERLKRDNEIGSIKYLYIISSYSGDVLQFSTVKGKVTSGGKRLSPKTVNGSSAVINNNYNSVLINGQAYTTDEVLDDGGAYGESGNYLFWFDAQDNYHQYYPAGGTYLHIADKPMRIKKSKIVIDIE